MVNTSVCHEGPPTDPAAVGVDATVVGGPTVDAAVGRTEGSGGEPAGRPAARHSVSIRSTTYPVVLPNPRDPRLHVAAVTLTVHALGQLWLHFQLSVPQLLVSILACALIEVAWTFRSSKAFVWPASAMLTGSGVALILRLPGTPVGDHWTFHQWYVYAAVAGGSLLTKYLIRHRGSPLFNPSNVGLVVAFVVLGSSRAEPLDFWWAPLGLGMVLAYGVIVIGGVAITARLGMLAGAVAFWLTLAAGTAIVAASGHCMTARWAYAPVCGVDYWVAIVTSPEVLIFMFFMITDPRTVPRGRVGHVSFCVLVGLASVVLMAPQSNEFWAKVGLLGGLTLMCAMRPLLERFLPERGSADDHLGRFTARLTGGDRIGRRRIVRIGVLGAALVAVPAGVVVAGIPARQPAVPSFADIVGRVPYEVDPSTMPTVTVEQDVLEWNHELTGDAIDQIVLTLVENLEVENQALLRGDPGLLEAVDHGERLDAMRARIAEAERTGRTVVHHYLIDTIDVVLLIPFGRQDGLSLGMQSRGTVTTRSYDATGEVRESSSAPFATTFVMRRATGDRWLDVAELELAG